MDGGDDMKDELFEAFLKALLGAAIMAPVTIIGIMVLLGVIRWH
jgi:hypothetical protein